MTTRTSFSDLINSYYTTISSGTLCRTITLQITDDCNCACSYCYQINKCHNKMSSETAKQILDLIFIMGDSTNYSDFIHSQTPGFIFDVIGGEPLLNLEVIEFICNYFVSQCLIKNKKQWLINSRFNISSNGSLVMTPQVQKLIEKYGLLISFAITIDGPQELHDKCRKYKNSDIGNFNDAFAASQYLELNQTKVTISPDNLSQINTIAEFFVNNNYLSIFMNPIYEHNWSKEEGAIYYQQLKLLANTILKNPDLFISVFNPEFYQSIAEDDLQCWCGGTGQMLAFDPDGIAYPCLRFMPSSLGNSQPPIIIGDCKKGIYNTPETEQIRKALENINRRTKTTDKCFYCPIASGCSDCSAWNYQESGKLNYKTLNTCLMHKAASLANVYFFNSYFKQNNINKQFKMYLPREEALEIISEEEYNMLYDLQK